MRSAVSSPHLPAAGSVVLPIWLVAALLLVAGCLVHYLGGYYFWGKAGFALGNDDAFISFRYAVNLVDSGELTYNVGESPRVEGYSNPLHVALAALVYGLGAGKDGLYAWMASIGVMAALASLWIVTGHVVQWHGAMAAVGVAMAFALWPSIWVHATSGLETPLVLLAQCVVWVAAVSAVSARSRAADVALLLATLCLVLLRTDGFVFPFIAAVWLAWHGRWRLAAGIVGAAVVLFCAVALMRHGYYAEWMPNTYYAKLNGAPLERLIYAVRILGSIALKNGLLLYLLATAVAGLLWLMNTWRTRRIEPPAFEIVAIAGLVAYYLLIGSDIYRERFLLILFPLGAVLITRLLLAGSAQPKAPWVAAMALVIASQLLALRLDPKFAYDFVRPKYDQWVHLGKFLAEQHPGQLLATGAAGKIPFFSGLRTIDTLGLNDHHIARTMAKGTIPGHGRFDMDYVFGRQPDLIAEHAYGDGDLVWGFSREVYEARGYRLTYLVRREDAADGAPIVRVDDTMDRAQVGRLVAAGYTFGVLTRQR